MINEVQVDQEEASRLAESHKITYFQTSAKDSIGIDLAMKTLITNIINNEKLTEKIDGSTNVRIGSTKPR